MPRQTTKPLAPRKTPVQARSAASVDAVLEATLQVLVAVGKQALTTTRVAARAGVSVGTLYQYFPNKRALLQAVLKRHLEKVAEAIEEVCQDTRGLPVAAMAEALVTAFLRAKMTDPRISVALYAISEDVEGARIAQQINLRALSAVADMLATAGDPLPRDPQLVANMIFGAMAGVSRRLLESDMPERHLPAMRRELIALISAYLGAATLPAAHP